MSARPTVFVDAMGGDLAPKINIKGSIQAASESDISIVLVGDRAQIAPSLEADFGKLRIPEYIRSRIRIEHTAETIEMDDHPAQAVRSKRDASLNVAMRLASETPRSAFLSAGNSGACLASAIMYMRRIPGVDRPAIAATLPTIRGFFLLVDAGANTQCKPQQLVQWALMGSRYYQTVFPNTLGSIGILSNGAEASKGTDLTRETAALLKRVQDAGLLAPDTFKGYIEGGRLFHGGVDVVVCDGFTGNIVLKSLEGLASAVTDMMKSALKSDWLAAVGMVFALRALKKLKQRVDYAEVGGAPLIGVNGHAFVAHGRSNPKAIKNAIQKAAKSAEHNLPEILGQVLRQAEQVMSQQMKESS